MWVEFHHMEGLGPSLPSLSSSLLGNRPSGSPFFPPDTPLWSNLNRITSSLYGFLTWLGSVFPLTDFDLLLRDIVFRLRFSSSLNMVFVLG